MRESVMGVHPLAPLLAPKSLAILGASDRAGSPGNAAVREVLRGRFTGRFYPVNPRYTAIDGVACYPALKDLPEAPDCVDLLVSNDKLEATLAEAIAARAKSVVIHDSCYLPNDRDPPLTKRLAAMAKAAGVHIMGGNCTGFMNLAERVRVNAYPPNHDMEAGHVTFISHSGSTYGGLCRNERRLRFNLLVSPGQELTTTAADYMDYALGMETTRAIGLMIETARDPQAFRASLEKAALRDIPVVVVKLARSDYGRRLALSHSGALAGEAAAYDALFDRYGVIRADDIDEMVATLLLFGEGKRARTGGLAGVHDSGGERELTVDLAEQMSVPYAAIAPKTTERLRKRLAFGLAPVNPVDFWSTPHEFKETLAECFDALLDDEGSALGIYFGNVVAGIGVYESEGEVLVELARRHAKPLAIASMFAASDHGDYGVRFSRQGVPVIYGAIPALKAARNLMRHRDMRLRPPVGVPIPPPGNVVRRWRDRLLEGRALDEADSLALLRDFGVPVQPHRIVDGEADAIAAAVALGYPVALKTAMPGILHKTERQGVVLGLADRASVAAAYADLAGRLGPRVLVARMAGPGTELALGAVVDPQWGPLVMAGSGGILIEVLRDVRFALAPIDAAAAAGLVDSLRIRPLLGGVRGGAAADLGSLAQALAQLSSIVHALGDVIESIDVNPFLAGPAGCAALDALVIPRKAAGA
jgi:acyl-CoA synthetase (NDP forming)